MSDSNQPLVGRIRKLISSLDESSICSSLPSSRPPNILGNSQGSLGESGLDLVNAPQIWGELQALLSSSSPMLHSQALQVMNQAHELFEYIKQDNSKLRNEVSLLQNEIRAKNSQVHTLIDKSLLAETSAKFLLEENVKLEKQINVTLENLQEDYVHRIKPCSSLSACLSAEQHKDENIEAKGGSSASTVDASCGMTESPEEKEVKFGREKDRENERLERVMTELIISERRNDALINFIEEWTGLDSHEGQAHLQEYSNELERLKKMVLQCIREFAILKDEVRGASKERISQLKDESKKEAMEKKIVQGVSRRTNPHEEGERKKAVKVVKYVKPLEWDSRQTLRANQLLFKEGLTIFKLQGKDGIQGEKKKIHFEYSDKGDVWLIWDREKTMRSIWNNMVTHLSRFSLSSLSAVTYGSSSECWKRVTCSGNQKKIDVCLCVSLYTKERRYDLIASTLQDIATLLIALSPYVKHSPGGINNLSQFIKARVISKIDSHCLRNKVSRAQMLLSAVRKTLVLKYQ